MALLEKHRNSFPDKSGSTFTFERFPENSTFAGSANPSWPSWYPVIDYARCNNCGQCAEFCLFGVYEKSDGKVAVVNPKSCKNNCPACARICPQVAIVFPKYAQGGVIGGSESFDEVAEMQRLQQDTDTILGNDIYQALESRKMKRRLIIRGDAMERAIRERDEALGHNPPSGPV
jgi:NAD-dependent dihydropyrimidine dehydrogenase PreA subunit